MADDPQAADVGQQPSPAGPPPQGTQYQTQGLSPNEERTWGMLAHLSALIGLVGIPSLVGPLVVWLIQKDKSAFVDDQGKEALNFHITVAIALAACFVLGLILLIVLVGFLFFVLAGVIAIVALIFTIIGAVQANQGEPYRYPINIRMIK